ncbi:hypothetical protein EOD43_00025 [Sphingomonas crocodyli]|uniref:Uncharacterized protein n=1 Tax=Sphingomonas crocodyli TaxID=1979270 RepID=A0A437MBG8_9SPHN|nr:hypothetical protein EOD43_00025 [Sphingomonas crocodyli]
MDKELRPCPKDQSGAGIVVCARTKERVALRYRLPIKQDGFDPAGPVDSVSRERHRMLDVGAGGTRSCSPIGPGGSTGCQSRDWKAAREQYGK